MALDARWLWLLVPLATALIGWVTNWAAVKMIFHPREFRGVGKLGWQGIIYRSAPTLAAMLGGIVASRLVKPAELAARVDPRQVADILDEALEGELPALVEEAMESLVPGTWTAMEPSGRSFVLGLARVELRGLTIETLSALGERAGELLDIERTVVAATTGENATTLSRMIQRVADKELLFIELYGGIFGLIIGVLEMTAYGLFERWWMMPIVGVLVGLLTNYLAILMIFRPQEPMTYLGFFRYQGLFPKRQAHIAREFGKDAAVDVITPETLFGPSLEGERAELLRTIVLEATEGRLGRARLRLRTLLGREVDGADLEQLASTLSPRLPELLAGIRPPLEAALRERLEVERLVEEGLGGLNRGEFERLLRPLFEEDEWIVVAVGGVLGGLVGLLQGLIVHFFV